MITLSQYWMDRDHAYPDQLTSEIKINAAETVTLVNWLLECAEESGVVPGTNPQTGTAVSSGWRPAAVNSAAHGATHSKHMTAQACDIRDTPDRVLAQWCLAHTDKLREIGLWMERPQWTPTWIHVQTVAPGSGHRVFVPNSSKPLASALSGEPPSDNT